MEANWLLMSLTLEAISHYLTRKNQYSLHKKLWSTNQRESIYNLWGWLVFTKWMGIHKNNKESKNDVPQRKIHRLFLPRVWCSCHDHTIRNIKRATPADIQKITNHRGIGLGNRPCPNLMQMSSSIMQIARESQQNAPTFFTGFLSCKYELYSRIVGIAISHHKINRYTITGFRGGIQRQNLRKNVLSSTVKNTMQRLRTWMKRHGPSKGCHSSLSHCAGVNCPNVRFTLPIILGCRLIPTHSYVLPSKYLTVCIPAQIPNQLQTKMSRIILSHQHSLKFGNIWRKVSSISSNPIDSTHRRGWLRIIIALPHHPNIWATTNSSKRVS